MKRFVLIFVVFFSFPAAAEMQDAWYQCVEDSDCAKAIGLCGGSVSVNKNHLNAHESFINIEKPRVMCFRAESPDETAIPICKENRCDLKRQEESPAQEKEKAQ